jgi:hypothetical protein
MNEIVAQAQMLVDLSIGGGGGSRVTKIGPAWAAAAAARNHPLLEEVLSLINLKL